MTTKFYTKCDVCDGEGGVSVYCCRGYDDIGNPDCGCRGQGDWEDCNYCDGTGKVPIDDIDWDFDTLDEVDRHDYQVYYSINGKGKNGNYIATAIYTHGAFDTLEDIEID